MSQLNQIYDSHELAAKVLTDIGYVWNPALEYYQRGIPRISQKEFWVEQCKGGKWVIVNASPRNPATMESAS